MAVSPLYLLRLALQKIANEAEADAAKMTDPAAKAELEKGQALIQNAIDKLAERDTSNAVQD